MKSVRLLGLPLAGILLLTFGSELCAGERDERAPSVSPVAMVEQDNDRQLIDLFMADDQNRLVDKLAGLEASLEKSEIALDDAELTAQEKSIEAASALIAKVEAEKAVAAARRVHDQAADALAAAEAERASVAALPPSQENKSELASIEAEIAKLRQDMQLAAEDLYRAQNRLKVARARLADAEKTIGKAEQNEALKRRRVASIEQRISAAQGVFDSERAKVVPLVAALSPAQREALQQSLGSFVKDRFVAVNIDASHLKRIVDDTYNTEQIQYLAKALRVEAEYRQFAALTGNDHLRHKAEREKARYLAEIDRLEAEKYDERLGGRSAFGVAAHPEPAAE